MGVVEVLALFTEDSKGTAKGMEFSVRFFPLGFSRQVVNGESGGGDGQSDEQVDEHFSFMLHPLPFPFYFFLLAIGKPRPVALETLDLELIITDLYFELELTRLSTDELSLDGHVVHV